MVSFGVIWMDPDNMIDAGLPQLNLSLHSKCETSPHRLARHSNSLQFALAFLLLCVIDPVGSHTPQKIAIPYTYIWVAISFFFTFESVQQIFRSS